MGYRYYEDLSISLALELEQEKIEQLQFLLGSIGATFEIVKPEKECGIAAFLVIKYEEKRVTRNAGRRCKYINVSVEELEKEIKETSVETVAQRLGIGKSSLYRRLKKAKDNGYDTVF